MLKTVENIELQISGLKIISKIGEGGMSVVYLAEQISLKREVAVKVMRMEVANNDMDVQRFKQEAKTIAHLDHPNIINIFNIGQTTKGEIYFTMPFLNHGDLSSYILEDEVEFIDLLKSVCDGLSFAHDRGVVHRDIKPENLLFDKFGNIRIADFGIAISKNGTRMTQEHQIVGSAQYMSPEQARSLKVDVHSDIYSLGIVIYERLTGSVPFDSDESISILVNHVSTIPPKLPAKMRHWQPLIDKCLAKLPKNRFQSMVELKIALEKLPIGSFQRTNNSIQTVLNDEKGKHLKWFIPTILLLLFVAIYVINNSKTPADKLNQEQVVNSQSSIGTKEQINPVIDENDLKVETIEEDTSFAFDEIKLPIIDDIEDSVDDRPLTEDENIAQLLEKAHENIKIYQLSKPHNNNATDQLLSVLKLRPDNAQAIIGIEDIGNKYYQLITTALDKSDFNTALKHSRSLSKFNIKTQLANSKNEIQIQSILANIEQINVAVESVSTEQLSTLTRMVKLLSPEHALIDVFAEAAKVKLGPAIGELFMDDLDVETVLVTENMAVTTREITLEQYQDFAEATNRGSSKCRHIGGGGNTIFSNRTWDKPYFDQNQDHPVVCVTYQDAVSYANWISQQTQITYRLPTKSEWLMLATETNNTFVACNSANVSGIEAKKIRNKEDKYSCDDKYKFTAPVASFSVNGIGIYDIQGNVSEWISCDASTCQSNSVMGSSWYNGQESNKLDRIETLKEDAAFSYVGFRLVREF